MATATVEIEEESFDKLIVNDLKTQYEMYWDHTDPIRSKKLRKAFKRVIEYYGGKVDE